MKFVGVLLLFGGYMLVYAATAKGGTFATEPWAALYADAYTGFGGGQGGVVSPANPRGLPQLPPGYKNPLAPLSPPGVNPQFP